jgi:hypothetical protein
MSLESLSTSQSSLDLFGNAALTPADLAPKGLLRIPMKEPAIANDFADAKEVGTLERSSCVEAASGFRLAGDRGLAAGWKRRGLDNLEPSGSPPRSRPKGGPRPHE